MRRSAGFTLLEVLVALLAFGIMSGIAYQGLISVSVTDETLDEEARALGRLQFAVGLIERDLRQSVPRGVRDGLGEALPALVGTRRSLSLTRAGWSNPTGQLRSELERVDYQFDGELLNRLSWTVLDRTQASTPTLLELLDGVERVDLAYLDEAGDWTPTWPPPTSGLTASGDERLREPWPRAITIVFETGRWGRIERSFNLIDAPRPQRGLAVPDTEEGDDGEA